MPPKLFLAHPSARTKRKSEAEEADESSNPPEEPESAQERSKEEVAVVPPLSEYKVSVIILELILQIVCILRGILQNHGLFSFCVN